MQIKGTLIALFIVVKDLGIVASITNFTGAKSSSKSSISPESVPLRLWVTFMKALEGHLSTLPGNHHDPPIRPPAFRKVGENPNKKMPMKAEFLGVSCSTAVKTRSSEFQPHRGV